MPAMRRAVYSAPGMPGVRILQGPAGCQRHGGRVNFFEFLVLNFELKIRLPFVFLTQN
jgi:hypothetical protein